MSENTEPAEDSHYPCRHCGACFTCGVECQPDCPSRQLDENLTSTTGATGASPLGTTAPPSSMPYGRAARM